MKRAVLRRAFRWSLVIVSAVVLVLVGLELTEREASEDATASENAPAHVEQIEGSELSRVSLEPDAALRIGLETEPVREAAGGRLVVPYSAVVYDEDGEAWVYTSSEDLTFVRAPVTIETIRGSRAILSDGPSTGTEVASVGVAEIYGAEFEVDH